MQPPAAGSSPSGVAVQLSPLDRTALITGGTGALGSAVVEAFLDAGWRVVVTWIVPGEATGW